MSSNYPKDVAIGPLNDNFKFFVANLSFEMTPQDVKGFFASFGAVNFVKLIYDAKESKSKGYGFLYMLDAAGDTAVQSFMDQHANRIFMLGKPRVFLNRHDSSREMPLTHKPSHDVGFVKIPKGQLGYQPQPQSQECHPYGHHQPPPNSYPSGYQHQQHQQQQQQQQQPMYPPNSQGSYSQPYPSPPQAYPTNHVPSYPPDGSNGSALYPPNNNQGPYPPNTSQGPYQQQHQQQPPYHPNNYAPQSYNGPPQGGYPDMNNYGPHGYAPPDQYIGPPDPYANQYSQPQNHQHYGDDLQHSQNSHYSNSQGSHSLYSNSQQSQSSSRGPPHSNQDSKRPFQNNSQGPSRPHNDSTRVLLGNLPEDVTPVTVTKCLMQHNLVVKTCTMDYNAETHSLSARVELQTPQDSVQCCALASQQSLMLDGRTLTATVEDRRQQTPHHRRDATRGPAHRGGGTPSSRGGRHGHSRDGRRDRPY